MAAGLSTLKELYILAELSRAGREGTEHTQSFIPLQKALQQWNTRQSGSTLRLKDLETGDWTEGWRQDYAPKVEEAKPYSVVLGHSRAYLKTRVASDI